MTEITITIFNLTSRTGVFFELYSLVFCFSSFKQAEVSETLNRVGSIFFTLHTTRVSISTRARLVLAWKTQEEKIYLFYTLSSRRRITSILRSKWKNFFVSSICCSNSSRFLLFFSCRSKSLITPSLSLLRSAVCISWTRKMIAEAKQSDAPKAIFAPQEIIVGSD